MIGAGRRAREALIALLVAAILGGAVWVWLQPGGQRLLQIAMPAVTLPSLQGQPVSLARFRGRVLLVNFWSTSCPGCIAEIPDLVALQQHFAGAPFTVIGIAMAGDEETQVAALAARLGMDYPLLMDPQGKAAQAFGSVNLTPTSFLVDAHGHIVERQVGAFPLKQWEQRIGTLLPVPQRAAEKGSPGGGA
ncbi:TlpA family protein disulfide reductase [Acidithiobacillus sp.]